MLSLDGNLQIDVYLSRIGWDLVQPVPKKKKKKKKTQKKKKKKKKKKKNFCTCLLCSLTNY